MYRRIALVGIADRGRDRSRCGAAAPGPAPVAHADGLTSYGSCDDLLQHYRTELAQIVDLPRLPGGRPIAAAADSATSSVAGRLRPGESGGRPARSAAGRPAPTCRSRASTSRTWPSCATAGWSSWSGNRLRVVSAEAQPRLLGSLRVTEQRHLGRRAAAGRRPRPGRRPRLAPGPAARRTRPTTRGGSRRTSWGPRPPRSSWSTCPTTSRGWSSARSTTGSTSAPGWSTARCGWSPRPGRSRWSYYPNAAGRAAEQQSRDANLRAAGAVGLDAAAPAGRSARDADGTVLEQGTAVSCDRTFHARNATGASTLLVTTLRPSDGLAATDRTAVTTDGDLVYASEDRLYVATSRWGTVAPLADTRIGHGQPGDRRGEHRSCTPSTPPRTPRRGTSAAAPSPATCSAAGRCPATRAPCGSRRPGSRRGTASETGRDVLDAGQAGRAGRCAGRDRPGRRARPDRADPGRALLRRHRSRRDVPADRPALPGRPVRRPRRCSASSRCPASRRTCTRSATACCSASVRTRPRTARSPACRCRCSTSRT